MTDKPVVLMPEDIQRIMGKDAQRDNILAAKMVSDVVKTTLGPKEWTRCWFLRQMTLLLLMMA